MSNTITGFITTYSFYHDLVRVRLQARDRYGPRSEWAATYKGSPKAVISNTPHKAFYDLQVVLTMDMRNEDKDMTVFEAFERFVMLDKLGLTY